MTLLICVIKHNNNKTEFISPWNYNFFEYRPTTPYVKHWNRGTFLLWMFFSGSNVQSLSLLTRSKERALPPYRVVEFCYERHVCVVWLAPIHIRTASLKMGQHFPFLLLVLIVIDRAVFSEPLAFFVRHLPKCSHPFLGHKNKTRRQEWLQSCQAVWVLGRGGKMRKFANPKRKLLQTCLSHYDPQIWREGFLVYNDNLSKIVLKFSRYTKKI